MKKWVVLLLAICSSLIPAHAQYWDLQNSFAISMPEGKGVITDGNRVFIHSQNLNLFYRYDLSGAIKGVFQISSLVNSGDFTTDGDYYYTVNTQNAIISKADFYAATPYVMDTFHTNLGGGYSFITYDSLADNGGGGFWLGGGSNAFYLVDTAGKPLDSIPHSVHGMSSIYGAALDRVTPNGPYLWVITDDETKNVTLSRIDLNTGEPSGISKSLTGFIADPGDKGAGLFIHPNLVSGSVSLGGTIESKKVFYFDLASASSERLDLEVFNINNLSYSSAQSNIAFDYTLKNHGYDSIHSVELSYQIDTGAVYTRTLTHLELGQFDTLVLRDTGSIRVHAGANAIKVWLGDVNGETDSSEYNNSSENTFYLYDLKIVSNASEVYVPHTQDFNVSYTIANFGMVDVSAYTVYYTINNGQEQLMRITPSPMLSQGQVNKVEFSLPIAIGDHTLEFRVDSPNDSLDQRLTGNSNTFNFTVYDSFARVPRTPMIEVFTSSTCGPCKYGNEVLTAVLENSDHNWACVKYQMNWPGSGDPYHTTEGAVRRDYYKVTGVPDMYIDGTYKKGPGSFSLSQLEQLQDVPAFVSIDPSFVFNRYAMDVDLTISPTVDIPSTDLRLFVVIVEKLTFNNKKNNGETEFEYVVKKMMTGSSGYSLSALTAGTEVTKQFSYKFNGSYRLPNDARSPINLATEHSVEEWDDLAVAVWVQDIKTKEVFQAGWASGEFLSVEQLPQEKRWTVYPNPTDNGLIISHAFTGNIAVHLVNHLGQDVTSKTTVLQQPKTIAVDTRNLSRGVYWLEMTVNGSTFHKQVQIL